MAGCCAMLVASVCTVGLPLAMAQPADLAELEEEAIAQAVEAVAPCVVQIQTVGGLDQPGQRSVGEGPTTGLVVSADGYVVSSAFGFAQEPTSILVRLPDGNQQAAELVGKDSNRMLVLLKINVAEPLPVPRAAPLGDVRPGDWAIAIGRTYNAADANVSVGVVSARNRMFGRVLQTDANVSAANYGGPLVDVQGRVLGVLVPMAPQSAGVADADAVAGAEFYDSGIGFAVPLEHTLGVLERWKAEKDLRRGVLGVGLKGGNPHLTPPIITALWPGSPAANAGLKVGDQIIEVNAAAVPTQAALRFQTTPLYAGDSLDVVVRRGDGDDAEKIEAEVALIGDLPPYRHAFLGVLPVRGATKPDGGEADAAAAEANAVAETKMSGDNGGGGGIAVRAVWPGSPADEADIRAGDRILRLDEEKVADLAGAFATLNAKSPGAPLAVVLVRGEEEVAVEVELGPLPTEILSAADLPDPDADDNDEANEPQLEELKLPEMSQTARLFHPAETSSPPGLLVWLGAGGEEPAKLLLEAWHRTCSRDGLVLLVPDPADAAGWSNDDMEYLGRLMQTVLGRFTIDPHRIVIAGEGKGGQLAYAVAFRGRRFFRGVVTVDSPMPRTLEPLENGPNERLAILSIETGDSPLSPLIRRDVRALDEAGYPVTQLNLARNSDRPEPLNASTRAKIARWIDVLDRL